MSNPDFTVLIVLGKAPQHMLRCFRLQVHQRMEGLQLWELFMCTKTRQHIPGM